MTICDCCGDELDGVGDHAHVMLPIATPSPKEIAAMTPAELDASVSGAPRTLDVCGSCIAPLRAAADARRKTGN